MSIGQDLSTRQKILLIALVLYVIDVWFHIPYAGGHIYSDIPSVFQERECTTGCNGVPLIPYVNGFIEYPPLVAFFIYFMGVAGNSIPGQILDNYYWLSVVLLAIPSLLLVDESLKIAKILGRDERRVLSYVVLTPTFVFILLVNWYAIGVYFSLLSLRLFLQGSRRLSGVFLGISAGANLVTAAPGVGMLLTLLTEKQRDKKQILTFAGTTFATVALINLPVILTHPQIWEEFWSFESSWYIEGSWMLAFLSRYSELRHIIFPVMLTLLLGSLYLFSQGKEKADKTVLLSWMVTSAYLFSTYVDPPQTNLMLLPFFAFLPIAKRYWEFLAFDTINALVIVVGFSQPFLIFGVTIKIDDFSYESAIQWLAILRALWIGKFLVWDGLMGRVEQRLPLAQGVEARDGSQIGKMYISKLWFFVLRKVGLRDAI